MATSVQLAVGDPRLMAAVRRCRRLLHRRAIAGAAVSAVPIPGLDWLVDAALLSNLLPAISAEFGLTPEQLQRLPSRKRDEVEKAIGMVGSLVIGKLVTRELVMKVAGAVGMRVSAKQATKYVPFAGQAVSAIVGYGVIHYLGEEHIRDCVLVCQAAQLQVPATPRAELLLPAPGDDA